MISTSSSSFANSLLFLKDFLVGMLVYFLDLLNKHIVWKTGIAAKFLDDFLNFCIIGILKKFTQYMLQKFGRKIISNDIIYVTHVLLHKFRKWTILPTTTISNQKMLDKMSFSMILITLGAQHCIYKIHRFPWWVLWDSSD